MKYYEVEINWNKDYGALFDYHIYIYRERERLQKVKRLQKDKLLDAS